MTNIAPGVYTSVTAAPPSPNGNAPTGTWFVTGETAQGPIGIPIPITSMNDYLAFLGARVSYGFLYDSLDEFFSDGGVQAYVSRVTGPSAAPATVTLLDRASETPLATLVVDASGPGVYGNNLSVTVAAGTADSSYTIQVLNSGVVVTTSPNLFSPADAVTWFSSQNPWEVMITVTNSGSITAPPGNLPALGTFPLTSGSDNTNGITETQWTAALTAFDEDLGPGQVSAPGHTTADGYIALANHAGTYNRVAFCDVADSATASDLITQATGIQSGATDPSYAALFAPWVIIPGIFSANPGSTSPVPSRIVPPSAMAAALVAKNDQTNTANMPAAGPNGQSTYAIGTTQTYSDSDRGLLNAAGVDVIRTRQGNTLVYGYRSLALDPNWIFLNNVRFRMQVINDFDSIGDSFIFSQIDGKGLLFASFNGALAGKCQQYWLDGSLYGLTAEAAYIVNTGPQVNTPTTIAAGQVNALVLLKMSPYGELVQIQVVKYLSSATLPQS